jgi:CheY-like chemotaxis protein
MRGTVLIVDDDLGVRWSVGQFLEADGWRVLSAAHGREALAVLEDEIPDLLLIDIAMPVMSGWKLCEALAHYPDLARIPRLLMGESEHLDAILIRVARVIEKPLDMGWLASEIAATLSPGPAAATAAA